MGDVRKRSESVEFLVDISWNAPEVPLNDYQVIPAGVSQRSRFALNCSHSSSSGRLSSHSGASGWLLLWSRSAGPRAETLCTTTTTADAGQGTALLLNSRKSVYLNMRPTNAANSTTPTLPDFRRDQKKLNDVYFWSTPVGTGRLRPRSTDDLRRQDRARWN